MFRHLYIRDHRMTTCFGVFIYAIIRPADIGVNFKLHCAKWDPMKCMGSHLAQCNLKLTPMSAGLMMAYIKTPKHVAV
jgi:hypothetical protein